MENNEDPEYIERSTRRAVGIAALKSLRKLVDEWEKEEQLNRKAVMVVAVPILTLIFPAILVFAWPRQMTTKP